MTPDDRLQRLVACVARWTGFHLEAVWPRAILKVVERLVAEGESLDAIVSRAEQDDAELCRRLCQAVSVGESFFFRHPEHFAFVRETVVPSWAGEPERLRRAWSAGCATGEEAYSLTATLEATGAHAFEVLGTDLVDANVGFARRGHYGPWSVRSSAPPPYPLFASPEGRAEWSTIRPELAARTRFEVHNLLEPPPPERFDLILCRNVLIYLSQDAAARVCERLVEALAPEGFLLFATMDPSALPPCVRRIGPAEQQVFQRTTRPPDAAPPTGSTPGPRGHTPPRRRSTGSIPVARGVPPSSRPVSVSPPLRPEGCLEPVALHLRALARIEQGDHRGAGELLAPLQRLAPGYLPGLLELALFCVRDGRRALAAEHMRALLEQSLRLPSDHPVSGPETLPASFYASAAAAFLRTEARR